MIKRTILFLLLLAAGFVALYFAVGSEMNATMRHLKNQGERGKSSKSGVIRFGGEKDPLSLKPGGAMDFPRMREVALPDGRTKQYALYKLHAEDSDADADNMLILNRVTVDFYELQSTAGKPEPRAVHSSTMNARRAKLQLSQDQNAVARIAEDKKMEFWGVVFETGGQGGAEVTRITLDRALALNTADAVHLWTPEPNEPVEIVSQDPADGTVSLRVRGLGLDAWIPTVRDKKGDLRVRESGIAQLTVKKDPVLSKEGTVLRSRGPLEYSELTDIGAARVTMVDKVEIHGLVPGGRAETLIATGDQLEAVLLRAGRGGDSRNGNDMVWSRITLTGQPVSLRQGEKMELVCEQLDVLPGIDGSPFWLTAQNLNPASRPKMRRTVDGTTTTFEAGSKVHMVQIAKQHSMLLEYFGIPGGHIPVEFQQLILFEGKSKVDSPKDQMTLSASRGLSMLRGEGARNDGYFVMNGKGSISIASSDLRIVGSNGFFMQQLPGEAKIRPPRRFIRLGPSRADPEHRYVVLRESDDKAFRIEGSGACRLETSATGESVIHLTSPARDIVARFPDADGQLSQVETLDAWFLAEGGLSRFDATGHPCQVEFETKEGRVTGEAQQVKSPRPDLYQLLGNLARINYRNEGHIRGKEILIYRLSTKDVMVKALREAVIVTNGRRVDLDLRLAADEVLMLPFILPPAVANLMFHRAHPVIGQLGSHRTQSRHLFATGHVDLTITQKKGDEIKTGQGHGDKLMLRVSADSDPFTDGKLIGNPAVLENVDLEGRRTTAEARLIDFCQEQKQEYVVLHPVGDFDPKLTIMGPQTGNDLEADLDSNNRMMTCEGLIRVEPSSIQFLGPVTVVSLGRDGQIDPRGMFVNADGMTMDRDRLGNVTSISASGDIHFRWDEIQGTADELSIDLMRTLMIARGIAKKARIELPGGPFTVSQVNYNYRTKMSKTWKAHYQQVTSYR